MSLIDKLNIFKKQDELDKKFDRLAQDITKELTKSPQYADSVVIQQDVPPAKKNTDYLKAYKHYVMRCVDARAKEVGNIKLHLYRRKGKEWAEVKEHALLNLLFRVNPFMTQTMFFHHIQAYKDLSGEAFVWKLRDKNKNIKEMWFLRPDWVDILPDPKTFIKAYRYRAGGSTREEDQVIIPPEDIMHFKDFNPLNQWRGKGIVESLAVEIDTYDYSGEYNRNFFYNSAKPAGVLYTEHNLKDEVRRRLEEAWKEKYAGRQNAFKTAILEGGLKWQDVGHTQKDMDFATLKTMSRDDILSVFQVPKSVIAISDDVNRANAREGRASFQEFVIDPLMRQIVGFLNEFLVSEYGEDLFLDYDPPAPVDQTQDLAYYESGIRNYWLSINEVREREGLEPLDDPKADKPLVPFNLLPLGDSMSNSAPDNNPDNSNDGGDGNSDNNNDNQDDNADDSNKGRKMNLLPPPRPIHEYIAETVSKRVGNSLLLKNKNAYVGITSQVSNPKNYKQTLDAIKKLKKKSLTEKKEEKSNYPFRLRFTRDIKEAYWKMLDNNARSYEDIFLLKLRRLLVKQESEVLVKLRNSNIKSKQTKAVKKELQNVLFNVDDETKLFSDVLTPILRDLILATGKSVYDFLGTDSDFDAGNVLVTSFLTDQGGTYIRSVNEETRKKITQSLALGVDAGEGTDDLAKRVRNVYREATGSRAEMIARTETIRANSFATEEAYKQSRVVEAKEWFTSKDERVCEWCAPLDGKIVKLGEDYFNKGDEFIGLSGGRLNFNLHSADNPPLHPNCRCTLLPVTLDDPDETVYSNSQRVYSSFNWDGLAGVDQATRNESTKKVFAKNFDWATGTVDQFDWEVRLINMKEVDVHAWQAGDKVDEYKTALLRGDKFPPMLAIKGVNDKDKYTILDGAHRTQALKELGADNIYLLVADPKDLLKSGKYTKKDVKRLVDVAKRAKELVEKQNYDPELANFRAMLEYLIYYFEFEVTIPN